MAAQEIIVLAGYAIALWSKAQVRSSVRTVKSGIENMDGQTRNLQVVAVSALWPMVEAVGHSKPATGHERGDIHKEVSLTFFGHINYVICLNSLENSTAPGISLLAT